MQIGDYARTSLDVRYQRYVNFVSRYEGVQPATFEVWDRTVRGVSPNSRASGIRLLSGTEHRQRQAERARNAGAVLANLTGA